MPPIESVLDSVKRRADEALMNRKNGVEEESRPSGMEEKRRKVEERKGEEVSEIIDISEDDESAELSSCSENVDPLVNENGKENGNETKLNHQNEMSEMSESNALNQMNELNPMNELNESSEANRTHRSAKSSGTTHTHRSTVSNESIESSSTPSSLSSDSSADSSTSIHSSLTSDSSKKKQHDGLRLQVTMKDSLVLGLVNEPNEILLQLTLLSLAGNCTMLSHRVCFPFASPLDRRIRFTHSPRGLHKHGPSLHGALARAHGLRLHRGTRPPVGVAGSAQRIDPSRST